MLAFNIGVNVDAQVASLIRARLLIILGANEPDVARAGDFAGGEAEPGFSAWQRPHSRLKFQHIAIAALRIGKFT